MFDPAVLLFALQGIQRGALPYMLGMKTVPMVTVDHAEEYERTRGQRMCISCGSITKPCCGH